MNKYLTFAVYPNGKKFQITRKRGHYWYTHSAGSNTMQGVKEAAEELGGKIVRELNTHYKSAPLFKF
jgi:hypothetical protein